MFDRQDTANSTTVVPAEWELQSAIWTAWPADVQLWAQDLQPAQQEVAAMINALAQYGQVNVLVAASARSAAEKLLGKKNVTLLAATYGDIWVRDSGPIFALKDNQKTALKFKFNGWGEKYLYKNDLLVADFIGKSSGVPICSYDFVLEGGSIEHDGQGTFLTTRECLLNPNRNPGYNQSQIEGFLCSALGAKKVIWLERGLLNDHTDGHIDNLARFVAPGKVVCQSPAGTDDPNKQVLLSIAAKLMRAGLEVVQLPGPGKISSAEGNILAASHMNYIIFNGIIIMPVYESYYSVQALKNLQELYPRHKVVGLEAYHLLSNGGGSFHCITQQEL